MANSKKRRHSMICRDCNGNGYVKIIRRSQRTLVYINVGIVNRKERFMWMSPKLLTFMLMMILLQVMLVSCTRDLQPNPYTTILKHMMKGKNGTQ